MAIFHGAVILIALVIWVFARFLLGRGIRFGTVLHVVLGAALGAIVLPVVTYLAIAPFVSFKDPTAATHLALGALLVALPLGAAGGAWATIALLRRLARRRRR